MRRGFPALAFVSALSLSASAAWAQSTVIFSDNFDGAGTTCGGAFSGASWQVMPGKINNYPMNQLVGSDCGHRKNHTGSPDFGGSAFEVDNNPAAYASYHEFDPQTGVIRLSAWVWEDAERPLCTTNSIQPVRGMIGLLSLPGDLSSTGLCGTNETYDCPDHVLAAEASGIPGDHPELEIIRILHRVGCSAHQRQHD